MTLALHILMFDVPSYCRHIVTLAERQARALTPSYRSTGQVVAYLNTRAAPTYATIRRVREDIIRRPVQYVGIGVGEGGLK